MAEVVEVKVFSETKFRDRRVMGETITVWLRTHAELQIVDKIVVQSSDSEFHCLSIILFMAERGVS